MTVLKIQLGPITKIPSIPSVPSGADPQTRQFLTAVKGAIETYEATRPNASILDKVVTNRDLVESGMGYLNLGGRILRGSGGSSSSGLQAGDYTPPPAIANFTASAAILSVILSWTAAPASANIAHYEIWRAGTNNIGVAVKVSTTPADVITDSVGAAGVTYYYWIRAVSRADVIGPFNAVAGTVATTGYVTGADVVSDTTPPGAPTTLTTTGMLKHIVVQWVNPANYDISVVEVWRSATNDRAASAKVGESRGTVYFDPTVGSFYYWVRALDSQATPNVGEFNAGVGATGTLGSSVTITSGNATTYMSTAAIDSALIANLTVDKLLSGTIASPTIYLGDTTFKLDGPTRLLTIQDQQATPVSRIKLGKLGAGASDYGIEIRDAAGAVVIGATGLGLAVVGNTQLQNLAVDSAKISSLTVDKLRTGTFGAYQINVGSGQITIDGADSTIKVFDTQATPVNRVKLGKLGTAATDYGIQIYSNTGSLIVGNTGLGLNVVGQAQIQNLAVGSAQIANLAVGTTHIAAAAITTAKIANLAVTDALIANLGVNKLLAGTIGAQQIYLGNTSFLLDGNTKRLTISDGTVNRVELGSLSSGGFGLTLKDSAGNVFLDSGGVRSSVLVARGQCVITGNSAQKVGGVAAFDSDVYSQTGFAGGAFCSGQAAQTNLDLMFGLNIDPVLDSTHNSIDYAIYFLPDATIQVYESGTSVGSYGTYTTTDVFSVTYDGSRISYAKNGFELTGTVVASGLTLYFDSSFYSPGAKLNNIVFRDLPGLSASRITAGTISASISITSPTITGGTISGNTITGGVFQTAASGERIDINSIAGRIRFIDSSGVDRVTIGSSGGGGTFSVKMSSSGASNTLFVSSPGGGYALQAVSTGATSIISGSTSASHWDFYANGVGINYGPFTGGHDGLASHDFIPIPGDIVCDREVIAKKNISNAICRIDYTTNIKDITAVGVLVGHSEITEQNMPAALIIKAKTETEGAEYIQPLEDLQAKYKRVTFNAVGEGLLNVCNEGGNINAGDYICTSSIKGKGMKQDDGVYRNYTVARARESASWDNSSDVFKQIACIYLAG